MVWHDVECGSLRRRPAALARPRARGAGGRARRRRRHRPRRAAARLRRPRRDRARPRPRAAGRARAARRRGRRDRSRRWPPTPNDFALPEPVGLVAVPMQTIQLLETRDGFFASARRALKPGGAASRWRSRPTSSPTTATRRCPRPDMGEADGWTYVSQPIAIRVDDEHVAIERIRQRDRPRRRARDRRRPDRAAGRHARRPGRGGRRARPARRGAAPHPRDARARGRPGGGLPWLTACASARCIRT